MKDDQKSQAAVTAGYTEPQQMDLFSDDGIYMKTASELDNSPVEWLVPGWIPKRGITLLCADGGTGKTFIWISLLASLSRGESTFLRYDPHLHSAHTVMCFSGEDPENIIRARLEKAGADLKNVYVSAQDSETSHDITFQSSQLEKIIRKYQPAIIVFDPLQSFIGSNVDMSRRNQMRSALKPLGFLSSKYNLPVLIIMHTNKRPGESGRDKMADSSDIWDQARSVIMCGFGENKQRYISLEKSSYANHMEVPTIIFSLDEGKVHFVETTPKKMKDFVKDARDQRKEAAQLDHPTKKQECANEILRILSEYNGECPGEIMVGLLSESGYSNKTIRTAREDLQKAGFITNKKTSESRTIIHRTEK